MGVTEKPSLWHIYNRNWVIAKNENHHVFITFPVGSKESCSQKLFSGTDITAWTGLWGSKHYPFILPRAELSIVATLEALETGCFGPGEGRVSLLETNEHAYELTC